MDYSKYGYLKNSEIPAKIREFGFNELPQEKPKTIWTLILSIFTEPMFLLLLACGGTYFLLGDKKEAIILLSSIIVIAVTTFVQEQKTEKTLEALKNLSNPKALVIRDEIETRVESREVVVGDLLVFQEGDRIAADCEVLQTTNLELDESLLTGESVSLIKNVGDKAFSGTLTIKGTGLGKVLATGKNTQIGQLGKSLSSIEIKPSLLQQETKTIVKIFATEALILCLILIVIVSKIRGNIYEGILSGLTLAMSAIPEEFPIILTIFLAFGAWRLSKRNVLTRRMPIIETLGAITVLCVDKTGTLTQNKMRLAQIGVDDEVDILTENGLSPNAHDKFHKLLEYAFLAGRYNPFDPIEQEIKSVLNKNLQNTEHIHKTQQLLKEFPMSEKLTAVTNFWTIEGDKVVGASKGAPESIFKLCNLPQEKIAKIIGTVQNLGSRGFRVLAVAESKDSRLYSQKEIAETDNIEKYTWEYLGLLAFEDPVKESVKEAVAECYSAGVNVKILTGDFAATAISVAKSVGLKNPEKILLGSEVEKMSDQELKDAIENVNVFSRVQPLHKLKIVRALLANNEVVGMTGDGVNDAPALKEAHVGISMGKRGTDVAREASALVLLDDDFSSIVKGIKQGRTIYDNIKKAMRFVVSVHIPIAGMALIPVVSGLPNFFFPIHILFLEMIIDPTSTIVYETEPAEENIMKRKPRGINEKIFTLQSLGNLILQGFVVLIVTFSAFYYFLVTSHSTNQSRGFAFIIMIIGNLILVWINRSSDGIGKLLKGKVKQNKSLVIICGLIFICLGVIFAVPGIKEMFKF